MNQRLALHVLASGSRGNAAVVEDTATGKGVAWFTTAVPDDAPLGQRSAFTMRAEQVIARIHP